MRSSSSYPRPFVPRGERSHGCRTPGGELSNAPLMRVPTWFLRPGRETASANWLRHGTAASMLWGVRSISFQSERRCWMATSLKPLGDRVIVKPKPKEEMTRSGIVLPDTASEKPQEGEVLSVGPGRMLDNGKRVEMEVKSGDTVLFAKYAGTEVKLDGDEYLVIRESDLLAIVSNGKK